MSDTNEGQFSLQWNHHNSTFLNGLSTLRLKETYSDVTLVCDGKFIAVHKFVLASCSSYFSELFEKISCKCPAVVLKDIKHCDLEALLDFIYLGKAVIQQSQLVGVLRAAECLKIKGLGIPEEINAELDKTIKKSLKSENLTLPPSKRLKKEISENWSLDSIGNKIINSTSNPSKISTNSSAKRISKSRRSLKHIHRSKNNSRKRKRKYLSPNKSSDVQSIRHDEVKNESKTNSQLKREKDKVPEEAAIKEEFSPSNDDMKETPEELFLRIGLPKFSRSLTPYMEGHDLQDDDEKMMESMLIEELAQHCMKHRIFFVLMNNVVRSKFYTCVQNGILKNYPNIIKKESVSKRDQKGSLGFVMSKMCLKLNHRKRKLEFQLDKSPTEAIPAATPTKVVKSEPDDQSNSPTASTKDEADSNNTRDSQSLSPGHCGVKSKEVKSPIRVDPGDSQSECNLLNGQKELHEESSGE